MVHCAPVLLYVTSAIALIPSIVSRVTTFLLKDETDYIYVPEDCFSSYTDFIQDIGGSSIY